MSRFVSAAGEQVADLIARAAEPGRVSRGRALFRKGAVSDLMVMKGSILASVRGSEGDEYETSVGTAAAPPGIVRQVVEGKSVDELIGEGVDICPREIDLGFGCDCADWDEPCKHVVAVLLAFADRVDLDESELLRWRGIERQSEVKATPVADSVTTNVIEQQANPEPKPRVRPLQPAPEPLDEQQDELIDRAARLAELKSLLGDSAMQPPVHRESDLEPDSDDDLESPLLEPALAEFFGVGMVIEPVDVSDFVSPAPLFAETQLGPLADLGPELAKALAIIADPESALG
ncbi:MAG: hypothetical protein ACRBK7_00420 [Acidimicrobiales bacterium]